MCLGAAGASRLSGLANRACLQSMSQFVLHKLVGTCNRTMRTCHHSSSSCAAAQACFSPVQKNRDKYGRIVGVCSIPEGAGRQDLNAWMVQEGYAVAYRCETAAAACTVVTTGLPAWAGAGGLRTGVQVRGCGCCGLPLLAW